MIKFTYDGYFGLINMIKKHGYTFCDYHDWIKHDKVVIMRHDVDVSLKKASRLASLEKELGIKSTYFVLFSSDFYNVFSSESSRYISEILDCGHEIGLHFDELRYPELDGDIASLRERIIFERDLLACAIGQDINTVSMHRPSKMMLDANLGIPNMVNSYGFEFFKGFKYVSDSRRNWREPVIDIIRSEEYKKLHILTHAFWYNVKEVTLKNTLLNYITNGNIARYNRMKDNFTNLEHEVDFRYIR